MASAHREANERRRAWRIAGTAFLVGGLLAVLFCADWDAAQRAEYDPIPPGPVGELIFQWWSVLGMVGAFVLGQWRWLVLPVLPLAAVSALVIAGIPHEPATIEPYERWNANDWWISGLPLIWLSRS